MADHRKTVLIIGAGQAAATAATALREYGYDGHIVMVGEESDPPYERPELSKTYLDGSADLSKLIMLSDKALAEARIDFRPKTTIKDVSFETGTARTDGGDRIAFDWLIFATGGRAATLEGCLSLRDRRDADVLRERINGAGSVGVLGAGWLGLEIAANVTAQGIRAEVYDPADWICARVLPKGVADTLMHLHACAQLSVHLGKRPDLAKLHQAHDLLVACIGMRPNEALAAGSGLDVDRGILVDPQQRTNVADVYAIGDCARQRGQLAVESWSYANASAIRAAASICGTPTPQTAPYWFWSKQGKTLIQMVGSIHPTMETEMEDIGAGSYVWRVFEDSKLTGAIVINSPRHFAKLKRDAQGWGHTLSEGAA